MNGKFDTRLYFRRICACVDFFINGLTSARLNEDGKIPVLIDLITVLVIKVTKCRELRMARML